MKLDQRWEDLVFSTLVSAGMSFVISTMTAVLYYILGLWDNFWAPYLRGMSIGFVIGIPAAMVLVPLVRRLVKRLVSSETDQAPHKKRRLLCMPTRSWAHSPHEWPLIPVDRYLVRHSPNSAKDR